MICNVCGSPVGDNDLFCEVCGAKKCPTCGTFNARNAQVCSGCNSSLVGGNTTSIPVQPNPYTNPQGPTSVGQNPYPNPQGPVQTNPYGYSGTPGGSPQNETLNQLKNGVGQIGGAVKGVLNNAGKQAPAPIQSGNDFVKLSDGEQVVKRYFCSEMTIGSTRVQGFLTVTNKRVVFHAQDRGNSKVVQEIPVDSVGAINSFYGTNKNIFKMIFGIVIVIFGVIMCTKAAESILALIFGLLIAAFGVYTISRANFRVFTLSIYSTKAASSPISLGNDANELLGGSAAKLALIGVAARDTAIMMEELGALIQDLQQMGDLAIEKWNK